MDEHFKQGYGQGWRCFSSRVMVNARVMVDARVMVNARVMINARLRVRV